MELIREEDLVTKDSTDKGNTEWHEHAQSQSVAAITHIDLDITKFQHRLSVVLIELVEYPIRMPYPKFKRICTERKRYGNIMIRTQDP